MEVKTKKSFNNLLESLVEEILDEEDLDEITTSAEAGAYSTPFAFDPEGEEKKKKYGKKKNSHRRKIGEDLNKQDLDIIKKVIRDVVGDIYRDIWLKRNSWK